MRGALRGPLHRAGAGGATEASIRGFPDMARMLHCLSGN
jgi:hypothetical protein